MSSEFRCVVCGSSYGDKHVRFCVGCWEYGTVLQVGSRARAEVDSVAQVTTARDLSRAAWERLEVPAYPDLVLGTGCLALAVGPAGSGKSTCLVRALDGMRGPVVVQSLEEAPGPSLASRLARVKVRRDDFFLVGRASVDQLVEVCRRVKAVALGIDSVQMASFSADELRHLTVVLPTVRTVWCTSQVNKQGRAAGREELIHEADLVLQLDAMKWTLTKSRYQPLGVSGDVLPPEENHGVAA